MKSNEYCECYKIRNTVELFDILNGRNDFIDTRKKLIFRGMENKDYKLQPSAIRDNSIELNKFISDNEMQSIKINSERLGEFNIKLPKDIKINHENVEKIENMEILFKNGKSSQF